MHINPHSQNHTTTFSEIAPSTTNESARIISAVSDFFTNIIASLTITSVNLVTYLRHSVSKKSTHTPDHPKTAPNTTSESTGTLPAVSEKNPDIKKQLDSSKSSQPRPIQGQDTDKIETLRSLKTEVDKLLLKNSPEYQVKLDKLNELLEEVIAKLMKKAINHRHSGLLKEATFLYLEATDLYKEITGLEDLYLLSILVSLYKSANDSENIKIVYERTLAHLNKNYPITYDNLEDTLLIVDLFKESNKYINAAKLLKEIAEVCRSKGLNVSAMKCLNKARKMLDLAPKKSHIVNPKIDKLEKIINRLEKIISQNFPIAVIITDRNNPTHSKKLIKPKKSKKPKPLRTGSAMNPKLSGYSLQPTHLKRSRNPGRIRHSNQPRQRC